MLAPAASAFPRSPSTSVRLWTSWPRLNSPLCAPRTRILHRTDDAVAGARDAADRQQVELIGCRQGGVADATVRVSLDRVARRSGRARDRGLVVGRFAYRARDRRRGPERRSREPARRGLCRWVVLSTRTATVPPLISNARARRPARRARGGRRSGEARGPLARSALRPADARTCGTPSVAA